MRHFLGRSVAVITLAGATVFPLSGIAQAAQQVPAAVSPAHHVGHGYDRCDRGRGEDEGRDYGGRRCCDRDRDDYRQQYGYRGGLLGGLLGIL
ncbi:hypothetical protein [Streptomyces sp. NPDC002221]|uniref:hypothetical protein n=1 Tax=Streptomyces sp. NPDC002221 TaxID=3364639 RepID=UPI0036B2AD7E